MINLEEIDRQLDEIKGTFSEFEALRIDNVNDVFFTLDSCMRPQHLWRASDIATLLGYEDKFKLNDFILKSFDSSIMYKIAVNEYCVPMLVVEDEGRRLDFALTRYGCYFAMLHVDASEINTFKLIKHLSKLMAVASHAAETNLDLEKMRKSKSETKDMMDFAKRTTFNQF